MEQKVRNGVMRWRLNAGAMNKRGEEFVEAAVVMPLIILTILSMITVAVFLFGFQIRQQEAHVSLMRDAAGSGKVFAVLRKNASSSEHVRGTTSGTYSRSKSYRAYALSQADGIMLGELAG